MKVYFDTAILVAASVSDHPHHSQGIAALRMVRNKEIVGHVSGHSLAEVCAVLTRTPFTPPVYPAEAWKLLSENIIPFFEIVALTPAIYRETIQECSESGWTGDRIYDALHIHCAKNAGCDLIYTFNVRHFRQLAPGWEERIAAP
jgi:predicted nucleic acid-binding protein